MLSKTTEFERHFLFPSVGWIKTIEPLCYMEVNYLVEGYVAN